MSCGRVVYRVEKSKDTWEKDLRFWFKSHLATGIWFSVRIMMLNATFNNISAISYRSVPEYPEKTTDVSHNAISGKPHLSGIRTHNVVVIGTGCICSCSSNYHTITIMTVLEWHLVIRWSYFYIFHKVSWLAVYQH